MNVAVNGVSVDIDAWPTRELAVVHELLRQRACELGLLTDAADATAIAHAIERTLAEDVPVPDPSEDECRRWYAANKKHYRSGDLVNARHILFQVTPKVSVPAIRAFAEATLKEIRAKPELFEERARKNSNCPSGANGGNLGQIQRGQMVAEFDKAIFETKTTGVLPALVKTRYGFHIVSVDQRIQGQQLPYEAVRAQVAKELRQRSEARALSQYVQVLAGHADIEGVELNATASPLLQ
ncbi:MAG: peptidylprolyl isomerase [Rhodanobacteraceae bacterium]|nr:MAG: peptidylprolyl isomerase [Rhodanobacteraceae bacterium]